MVGGCGHALMLGHLSFSDIRQVLWKIEPMLPSTGGVITVIVKDLCLTALPSVAIILE